MEPQPGYPDWVDVIGLFVSLVRDNAIFTLDADGVITSWNAGAERIGGFRPDGIVGRHLSTLYSSDDVALGKVERLLDRARRLGSALDVGWLLREDGSRFWADLTISAIRDGDGDLRGFATVARDLTDPIRRASFENDELRRSMATVVRLTQGLEASSLDHAQREQVGQIRRVASQILDMVESGRGDDARAPAEGGRG